MKQWMDQYGFAVLFAALLLACVGVAFADIMLPVEHKTVTIRGLCEGWKAWREVNGNLWVGCPGSTPPDGSVELRAYYRLP